MKKHKIVQGVICVILLLIAGLFMPDKEVMIGVFFMMFAHEVVKVKL